MGDSTNILFIVMDTARQKTVGELLEDGTMAETSNFAKDGRTFTNAISAAPWTLPSHASLLTGQYTEDHNSHAGSKQFEPDVPPLPEEFAKNGYNTAAISANPWISPEFGFDQGFQEFSTSNSIGWGESPIERARNEERDLQKIAVLAKHALSSPGDIPALIGEAYQQRFGGGLPDDGAERITDRAVKWMRKKTAENKPWFLLLNYMEPHLPYEPPQEWFEQHYPEILYSDVEAMLMDSWPYVVGNVELNGDDFDFLEKCYKSELEYLDTHLSRLYSTLEASDALDDTVVVVVGDHGDNIGERGRMGHQHSLLDTLVNVPLIIRYPDAIDPGIDDGLIETRDLYPTLLSLADLNASVPTESVSQNRLHYGDRRDTAFSQYVTVQPSIESIEEEYGGSVPEHFGCALRSVRTDRWKLIERDDGSVLLFDKHSDDEFKDVSAENQQVTNQLSKRLQTKFGNIGVSGETTWDVPEESRDRLADLGYI
jgi:arylsulfatase A-like enzyme